jgi:4,5:9,10-diseco-3-hydroxy-5,9,17-trioxoandrosta-1(10),2-diene-4-oate hydrolase
MENSIESEYEKYITVEGMKIRYMVKGAGSPLLLLHGFGEFLESWDLNIRPLSEHYQVYAMDLPGHGLSDKPDVAYNLFFFTKFITNFMQALGIEHASLIGHSMGGHISLSVAINFSEKVDSLVLETSAGLSNDVSLLRKACSIPVLGSADTKESMEKIALEQRIKREFYNPDFVAKEMVDMSYRFMQMPEAKRVMLSMLHHAVTPDGLRPEVVMTDRLHLVKSPTLLIHGAQDEIHPLELSQNACRLIPNVRLQVIDECGHCPHIEKAAEFNEAVIAFFSLKERRGGRY